MTVQLENRIVVHYSRQKKYFSKSQRQYYFLANRATRNMSCTRTYIQSITPPSTTATLVHILQTDSPMSRVKKLEYSPLNKNFYAQTKRCNHKVYSIWMVLNMAPSTKSNTYINSKFLTICHVQAHKTLPCRLQITSWQGQDKPPGY